MKLSRAWILALLMAGACLPARAQRKIVETAPGTVTPGSTNTLGPEAPSETRGGGLFDRLYRPNSIQLAPLDTAPSASSGASAKIDPALRKRLIEEQSKRKNWAIENAARMNRGESPGDRRRPDGAGRRSAISGREPTAAELNLQAVDPKYAREFKENSRNPTEVGLEQSRLRADRQRRQRDGKGSGEPQTAGDRQRGTGSDELEDPAELDPRSAAEKSDRELDRWDKVTRGYDDPLKAESPLDRAAARLAAGDSFDFSPRSVGGGGDLDLSGETQRQERLSELSNILGEPTTASTAGSAPEGFLSPTPSDRTSEFQKLLAPEVAPTAVSRLGGETTLGNAAAGRGGSAGASAAQRELPGLSAPTPGFNLSPAASTPALAPATPRMTPRPIQLPAPVRGKGGF